MANSKLITGLNVLVSQNELNNYVFYHTDKNKNDLLVILLSKVLEKELLLSDSVCNRLISSSAPSRL